MPIRGKPKKPASYIRRYAGLLTSGSLLLFSVGMLLLFPRKEHIAAATVFAVLFWLSLIACVGLAVVTVRNRGKPQKEKARTRNCLEQLRKNTDCREEQSK